VQKDSLANLAGNYKKRNCAVKGVGAILIILQTTVDSL
jgi:hypothetical protein